MTMDGLVIREATDSDWPAIWPIWRDVVARGDTYTWDLDDMDETAARAVWMPGPPARTFIAASSRGGFEGSIVGTALLRPNQVGRGDHVANAGFMVSPTAQGQGVGRRLAGFVIDRARAEGYRAMQFNAVVSTNIHAIALRTDLGFDTVGRIPGAFRHPTEGEVDLLVMHRRL